MLTGDWKGNIIIVMDYKIKIIIKNEDEFINYLLKNNIKELNQESLYKIIKEFKFKFDTEIIS